MSASRKSVIIHWPLSSLYGWGIYGINLASFWATDDEVMPLCASPIYDDEIILDPLRRHRLTETFGYSRRLHATIAPYTKRSVRIDSPVLMPLANGLRGIGAAAHTILLIGHPSIGIIFFEDTDLNEEACERAKRYPLIVAGSTWNRDVLQAASIGPVAVVLQGVDPTLFHPGPRSGMWHDRFLIFSGGKLEYRKGQDLVLLAFRAFAKRHPEAMLVTAWQSPNRNDEPATLVNPALAALPQVSRGLIRISEWAAANGVPPDRVIDLGLLPNIQMPSILREMDVAVFPNRCEGGTNLVAMECMACGVPTILSRNTGHLDLIRADNSIALAQQCPISGSPAGFIGTEGWGESDVEEIVEALEAVWRDRETARRIGERGAAFMQGLSWERQTRALKETLRPFILK